MAQRSPVPYPPSTSPVKGTPSDRTWRLDVYFSADVETDGPIPGPFSMLSIGIAFAGTFDGTTFRRPTERATFYRELRPISEEFETRALEINGLDRNRLIHEGCSPEAAMREASDWIASVCREGEPVLVAYPLSFDWTWLYWYFMKFAKASPFNHSRCYDVKTAYAVKARLPVSGAGRAKLPEHLLPQVPHTHNALDDALEQAEIFARVFEWSGDEGRNEEQE